ncbi:unnamed protein product [Pylaiella littoralis]
MIPTVLLWLASSVLLLGRAIEAINVEYSEVHPLEEAHAEGEFTRDNIFAIEEDYGGVDPIDNDCYGDKCVGLLTRDGSVDLGSRYGCTEPQQLDGGGDVCGVLYWLNYGYSDTVIISQVKIALHPDSVTKVRVLVDNQVAVEEWDAVTGSTDLQEIPGLEGLEAGTIALEGVMGIGEYFAILETEIYIIVDEVEPIGVSASTRATVSATATANEASAMNTLDGDATDASSWSCSSESCEITYDLETMESLQQLRVAFSEDTDAGGELNLMAADESGVFSSVKSGIEAGGRPLGSDGLQTFGGIRSLARYVKIVAVPSSGGKIGINEASNAMPSVELRVREDAPTRPVAEKKWLKETGMLPMGSDPSSSLEPNYDSRAASDGGCDPPAALDGCSIYYIKDGDMDTRWSCGPLSTGESSFRPSECEVDFSLNYYRYVRQIKLAFHIGDELYKEFSVMAFTALLGWVTVVPSAISSGETTGFQTFDVNVHTNAIRLVPKYTRIGEVFSVTEMVILERRKQDFVEGTVPVFHVYENFVSGGADFENNDDFSSIAEEASPEAPTHFKFDIPARDDEVRVVLPDARVTAVRMRFPAGRKFVFTVEYSLGQFFDDGQNTDEFTSAGGEKMWETFTLSDTALYDLSIAAVTGPSFENFPDYPTLRVVDFQVVGELTNYNDDGYDIYLNMVTTTTSIWELIPDIIGDGVSDQEEIMMAICEAKGAAFDGTDCVGELNDSTFYLNLRTGDHYVDGPVFLKSGVTISGRISGDSPNYTTFILYDGDNNGKTSEDAMLVIDGVVGGVVEDIFFQHKTPMTGEIVPGTIGNLCMEVRNSEELRFSELRLSDARTGGATFADSKNISTFIFWSGQYETGNYMELTRVDDFYVRSFPDMAGLLIDTSNNIWFQGEDEFEFPTAVISPPTGGDQTASVVITGDSSGIILQNCVVAAGADPRILVESTEPVTLDNVIEYEEAVSGDCMVEVPTGTGVDLIIQTRTDPDDDSTGEVNPQLVKSGNCWVLE